eukprot:9487018-Pyramimonas_sp.AAC.1
MALGPEIGTKRSNVNIKSTHTHTPGMPTPDVRGRSFPPCRRRHSPPRAHCSDMGGHLGID